MDSTIKIDLHKISRFVNFSLPLVAVIALLAGNYISFYFHFLSVTLIFLTLINIFYLFVQTDHTLLRNFGLIGQGRYLIESIGPELRQYLFASDTEERPFNREERSEVYRKAKGLDSTSSFGSQQSFDASEIKIRHSMYPVSKKDKKPYGITFGEERGLSSAYTIKRPFIISAMSFGALNERAVGALARGAKQAGIPMNTGEGGFPKYHLEEGCDLIFQMGTAKFGVRKADGALDPQKLGDLAREEAIKMIEIKFSQGAKPGKGGILPKEKITPEIAGLRGVSMDRDVISPPHHAECTDERSTVSFIGYVQEVSNLPVGIKMCLGSFGEFRSLVKEMKAQGIFPDYISIDGAEGGTGAAPKAFMDSYGVPIFPALTGVQKILETEGIRDQLKLMAAGKLINPAKQMIAFCLGADAIYTARGFMLALGCIQALQCGKNTCPVGITTHDPELKRGLDIEIKASRVRNYVDQLEHDIDELWTATGKQSIRDLTMDDLYVPQLHPVAQIANMSI